MLRALTGIILAISLSTSVLLAEETTRTRVADGFDFPVGDRSGDGYHKARGFQAGGHPGEDWNGANGGDSDLGDAVYAIGNGVVMLARNAGGGWGNSVIVRHAYRENGQVKFIDSLYAHLDRIGVREGQRVARRERIGTIGTNGGMYHAHLHFEIRKNLRVGMNRSSCSSDLTNYFDPTRFIATHRSLDATAESSTLIAMNTFSMPEEREYARTPAKSSGSTLRTPAGLKLRITATFGETKVRRFD